MNCGKVSSGSEGMHGIADLKTKIGEKNRKMYTGNERTYGGDDA